MNGNSDMNFKDYLVEALAKPKPKKFDKNKKFVFKLPKKLVNNGTIDAQRIADVVDSIKSLWKIDYDYKEIDAIDVSTGNQSSFNAFIKALRADTGLKRPDVVRYYKKPRSTQKPKSVFKKTITDFAKALDKDASIKSSVVKIKDKKIIFEYAANTNRYSVNYGEPSRSVVGTKTVFWIETINDKHVYVAFLDLNGGNDQIQLRSFNNPPLTDQQLNNMFNGDGLGGDWGAIPSKLPADTKTVDIIKKIYDIAKIPQKTKPEVKPKQEEPYKKTVKVQDGDRVGVGDFVGWKDDYEQYGKVIGFKGSEIIVQPDENDDGDTISLDPSYFWKV